MTSCSFYPLWHSHRPASVRTHPYYWDMMSLTTSHWCQSKDTECKNSKIKDKRTWPQNWGTVPLRLRGLAASFLSAAWRLPLVVFRGLSWGLPIIALLDPRAVWTMTPLPWPPAPLVTPEEPPEDSPPTVASSTSINLLEVSLDRIESPQPNITSSRSFLSFCSSNSIGRIWHWLQISLIYGDGW